MEDPSSSIAAAVPQQAPPLAATAATTTGHQRSSQGTSSIALCFLRLFALSFVCLVLAVLRKQYNLPFAAVEGLAPLILFVIADRETSPSFRSGGAFDTPQASVGSAARQQHYKQQQSLRRQAQWVELSLYCGAAYLFLDSFALDQGAAVVLAVNAVQWALGSFIPSLLSVMFTWLCYQFVDETYAPMGGGGGGGGASGGDDAVGASSGGSSADSKSFFEQLLTLSVTSMQPGLTTAPVVHSGSHHLPSPHQHLRSLGIGYEPPRWITALCLALSVQLLLNSSHILSHYRSHALVTLAEYIGELRNYAAHRIAVWRGDVVAVAAPSITLAKKATAAAAAAPPRNASSPPPFLSGAWVIGACVDLLDSVTYFVSVPSVMGFVLWYALISVDWYAHLSLGGALLMCFTLLAVPQGHRRSTTATTNSSNIAPVAGGGSSSRNSTPVMGFVSVVAAVDSVVFLIASPKAICMVANGVISAFAVLYFWNHSRSSAISRPALPLAVVWITMVGLDLWVQLEHNFHLLMHSTSVASVASGYRQHPYLWSGGISTGEAPPGGIAGATVAILAALVSEAETPSPLRHFIAVHTTGFGMYLLYSAFVETSRVTMLAEQELKILTFLAQPPAASTNPCDAAVAEPPQEKTVKNQHASRRAGASSHSSRGVSPVQQIAVAGLANDSRLSATESESSIASSGTPALLSGGVNNAKQLRTQPPLSSPETPVDAVAPNLSVAVEEGHSQPITIADRDAPLQSPSSNETSDHVSTPTELQPPKSEACDTHGLPTGSTIITDVNAVASSNQPSTEPSRDVTPLGHTELIHAGGASKNSTAASKKGTKNKSSLDSPPPQRTDGESVVSAGATTNPSAVLPQQPPPHVSPPQEPKASAKGKKAAADRTEGTTVAKSNTATTTLVQSGSADHPPTEEKPPRRVVAPPLAIAYEHLEEGEPLEAAKQIGRGKQSTAKTTTASSKVKAPAAAAAAAPNSKSSSVSSAPVATSKLTFGDVVRGAKPTNQPALPSSASAPKPANCDPAVRGPLSVDGPETSLKVSSSAATTQSIGKPSASRCAAIASVDAPDDEPVSIAVPLPTPKSKAAALRRDEEKKAHTYAALPHAPTSPLLTKASKSIMSIDGNEQVDDDMEDSPRALGSTSNPVVPPSPHRLSAGTGAVRPPPISPQQNKQHTKNEKSAGGSGKGGKFPDVAPSIAPRATLPLGGPQQSDGSHENVYSAGTFDHFGGLRLGTSPLIRERGPLPFVHSHDAEIPTAEPLDLAMFHLALTGNSLEQSSSAVAQSANNGSNSFPTTADDDASGGSSAVMNIDTMISQLASTGNSPLPSGTPLFPEPQDAHNASSAASGMFQSQKRSTSQFLTLEELTKAVNATPTRPAAFEQGGAQNGDDGASSTSAASSSAWAPAQPHASDAHYEALSQGFLKNLLDDEQPYSHGFNRGSSNTAFSNQGIHAAFGTPTSSVGQQPPPALPGYPTQPQIFQVAPNGGVVPVPSGGGAGGSVSQVVMTNQGPYAVVTLSNGQQIMCPVVYQPPQPPPCVSTAHGTTTPSAQPGQPPA